MGELTVCKSSGDGVNTNILLTTGERERKNGKTNLEKQLSCSMQRFMFPFFPFSFTYDSHSKMIVAIFILPFLSTCVST